VSGARLNLPFLALLLLLGVIPLSLGAVQLQRGSDPSAFFAVVPLAIVAGAHLVTQGRLPATATKRVDPVLLKLVAAVAVVVALCAVGLAIYRA
jgi:ABC-type transport system involved in cytochrome c biogenesis permease subunit